MRRFTEDGDGPPPLLDELEVGGCRRIVFDCTSDGFCCVDVVGVELGGVVTTGIASISRGASSLSARSFLFSLMDSFLDVDCCFCCETLQESSVLWLFSALLALVGYTLEGSFCDCGSSCCELREISISDECVLSGSMLTL